MTQEDKELLLIDFCIRLPYKVKYYDSDNDEIFVLDDLEDISSGWPITNNGNACLEFIKPYLRPMSSMTEEEKNELLCIINRESDMIRKQLISGDCGIMEGKYHFNNCLELDWLNKHHFDYRGLIEKRLALEAPKDMYKFD